MQSESPHLEMAGATSSAHRIREASVHRVDSSFELPAQGCDAGGYWHPRSEAEIQALVQHARAQGLQVRVRGAAHSVPAAIHSDARLRAGAGAAPAADQALEMVLDLYGGVTFDDARRQVTVQAGCRFGADPHDPTGRASLEAGLCAQLEARGWALPNLAGVTHMTVAGLLSTGAAGGSVRHGLHEAVVGMRIVDGTGVVRVLSPSDDAARFLAAGVAMGLLGVVSTVTLQCVPRFDVIGSESTTTVARAPFDLCGSGPGSLEAFLREAEYARVLWWPQRGVDKLVVWQARRMTAADYGDDTGPAWALRARRYRAFDPLLGSTLPLQVVAGGALTVLGGWRSAVSQVAGPLLGGVLEALAERVGLARMESALIDTFVPEDRGAPKRFWDSWHRALPMDDEIDERALPTSFTEIWLPLEHTGEAMRRLRDLYRDDPAAAGSFVTEIYAAGASPFWMSPAHGQPMLRINLFWLENNPGDPRETFFPRVWSLFEDLSPRLHWAKLVPLDARAAGRSLAPTYQRWDDFLKVRAELDPDGLFATHYWNALLGLDDGDAAPPPLAPLPRRRSFDRPAMGGKWPALFRMAPTDAGFVDSAERVITARGYVPAPPIATYAVIAHFDENPRWLPGYLRTDWLSERGAHVGAVMEEVFSYMTIRVRVRESIPGKSWVGEVLACSLPLGTAMSTHIAFDLAPDGGTDVTWRVGYDLPPALVPLDPLVAPVFKRLFESYVAALARYLGRPGSSPAAEAALRAVADMESAPKSGEVSR